MLVWPALTEIQNMDIGKTGMAITASEDNHLITYEIRSVISFFLRDIAFGLPFSPSQGVRIGDIQGPNIIQSCLTIASSKDYQIVLVEDCAMGASWRRQG